MSEQIDTTENLYAQVRNLTRERNFLRMQLAGIAAERHHSGVEELAYQLRQAQAHIENLRTDNTLLRRQLRMAEKEIPATALEVPIALKLEHLQRHHRKHVEQARISKGILRSRIRTLTRKAQELEWQIESLTSPRPATYVPEHEARIPRLKSWVPLIDDWGDDDPADHTIPIYLAGPRGLNR